MDYINVRPNIPDPMGYFIFSNKEVKIVKTLNFAKWR
jgi:hypothetical protein